MQKTITVVLACILIGGIACSRADSATDPIPRPGGGQAPGGVRVLFVGNSLTYVNNLPGVLTAIAAAAGDTIRTEAAVGGNLALIDHWYGATDAVARIRAGGWDYVVLQQGPTSQIGVDRDTLVLATRLFDGEIRKVGATPALYMVWPSADRLAFFDNVHAAYAAAAQEVGGLFLPAGEAWRIAWRVDRQLPLYGGDHFHPSVLGTYLAALVIYECLTGHDVTRLSPLPRVNNQPFTIAPVSWTVLTGAAHEAARSCAGRA